MHIHIGIISMSVKIAFRINAVARVEVRGLGLHYRNNFDPILMYIRIGVISISRGDRV